MVVTSPPVVFSQGNSQAVRVKVEAIPAAHHDHSFVLRDAPGKPMDTSTLKETKDKRRMLYADSPKFAIFNKSTGATVYGPVAGNTLFTGFGGACETSSNGDPVLQYDKLANRWVLMQFAVLTGGPYY